MSKYSYRVDLKLRCKFEGTIEKLGQKVPSSEKRKLRRNVINREMSRNGTITRRLTAGTARTNNTYVCSTHARTHTSQQVRPRRWTQYTTQETGERCFFLIVSFDRHPIYLSALPPERLHDLLIRREGTVRSRSTRGRRRYRDTVAATFHSGATQQARSFVFKVVHRQIG